MLKIDENAIDAWYAELETQSLNRETKNQYRNAVKRLREFTGGEVAHKEQMEDFVHSLREAGYAERSCNVFIFAVNSFLRFHGYHSWALKGISISRLENRWGGVEENITKQEYLRLVETAMQQGDERLALMIEALCVLCIRISELSMVTYESCRAGKIRIERKTRTVVIPIPDTFAIRLMEYCREKGILSGPVFVTRNGKPVNRSNLYKKIKRLAEDAGVQEQKVFSKKLNQLLVQSYYDRYGDTPLLAGLVGTESVVLKRLYARTEEAEQRQRVSALEMVV